MSQYRVENEERARMLLQQEKLSTSQSDGSNSDFSDESGNRAKKGKTIIPFDIAHPPSPKVSKGPNVKHTSTVTKRNTDISSSSDLSSDIDM